MLLFEVQHSAGQSQTWQVFASDITTTAFPVDVCTLSGSDGQSLIRIIAKAESIDLCVRIRYNMVHVACLGFSFNMGFWVFLLSFPKSPAVCVHKPTLLALPYP